LFSCSFQRGQSPWGTGLETCPLFVSSLSEEKEQSKERQRKSGEKSIQNSRNLL